MIRRLLTLITAAAIVATACASSTTTLSAVENESEPELAAAPAPTATPEVEPTAEIEPAAEPAPTETPEPTAEIEPAAEPAPTETPEPTVEPEPTATAEPTETPEEAVVRLLDAGAEPRTELRLDIAPTCGETLTMIQNIELTQLVDGEPLTQNASGTIVETAITVAANGENYDVRTEIVDARSTADTPTEISAQVDIALQDALGLATLRTITNRGVLVPGTDRIEGTAGLGVVGEVAESINSVQSPLPVEPVGVGARWEVTNFIELQGLIVESTTVSELLSVQGTIVELAVTGMQQVEPDAVMNVEGISAEVLQWDSVSTGEMVMDLATISPLRASARTDAIQIFDFSEGITDGVLEQTIVNEQEVSASPDDGCTGRSVKS